MTSSTLKKKRFYSNNLTIGKYYISKKKKRNGFINKYNKIIKYIKNMQKIIKVNFHYIEIYFNYSIICSI